MDPKAFDEGSIYYHILSNVIAGAETTGIALSAVFYYLDRHRTVLAKLRAELDAFMAKREAKGFITMKESLELPYLQAVLKEALRMFPSAGLPLPRVVPKGGLTLAGQFFPEGVRASMPPKSTIPFVEACADETLIDHRRHQRLGRPRQPRRLRPRRR